MIRENIAELMYSRTIGKGINVVERIGETGWYWEDIISVLITVHLERLLIRQKERNGCYKREWRKWRIKKNGRGLIWGAYIWNVERIKAWSVSRYEQVISVEDVYGLYARTLVQVYIVIRLIENGGRKRIFFLVFMLYGAGMSVEDLACGMVLQEWQWVVERINIQKRTTFLSK